MIAIFKMRKQVFPILRKSGSINESLRYLCSLFPEANKPTSSSSCAQCHAIKVSFLHHHPDYYTSFQLVFPFLHLHTNHMQLRLALSRQIVLLGLRNQLMVGEMNPHSFIYRWECSPCRIYKNMAQFCHM